MLPPSSDDTNWDLFDPNAYIGHNYAASVLPEDARIIDHIVQRIEELRLTPRSMQRVVNVGHGSVFAIDPVIQHLIHDHGSYDLVEYGEQNLASMRETIRRGLRGDKGIWGKFEKHATFKSPIFAGGLDRAWRLCNVIPGSIHELAKNTYDAGFTFYCPESITSEMHVFEHAVHQLIDSIKHGGLFVMAFMRGSEGYDTPGKLFPAVAVDCEEVYELLREKLKDLEVIPIQAPHGMRPADGPQYTGIGLATGIRR
jgi:hypothetical protein